MATSKIACPKCSTALSGGTELIGRRIKCPRCGQVFMAGAPGTLQLDAVRPTSRGPRSAASGSSTVPLVAAIVLVLLLGGGVGAYFIMNALKANDQGQARVDSKKQTSAPGTSSGKFPSEPGNNGGKPATDKKDTGTTEPLPPATGTGKPVEDPEPKKIEPPMPEPKKVEPPTPEPKKVEPPTPEPKKVEPPTPEPKKIDPTLDPDLPKLDPSKKPDPMPIKQPGKTPPKNDDEYRTHLSDANQEKVNEAVKKAIDFLKKTQKDDGSWRTGHLSVAYAALPALTLLECGEKASDPVIQKAAMHVRKNVYSLDGSPHENYELSVAIIFLDRLGLDQDAPLIHYMATRLMTAQQRNGAWGYNNILSQTDMSQAASYFKFMFPEPCFISNTGTIQKVVLNPKVPVVDLKPIPGTVVEPLFQPINMKTVPPKLAGTGLGLLSSMPGTKVPTPLFPNGRMAPFPSANADNSNTQFAMMAVWIARKYNQPKYNRIIKLPAYKAMALVDQHFRSEQNPDGSWSYTGKGKTSYTMTCAGLIGLGLGFAGHIESLGAAWPLANLTPLPKDPAVEKALEVISQDIGDAPPTWDAKSTMGNLYFVWSVERVAMLYKLKHIGGKDWYSWAAHMLVVNQDKDGSWKKGNYSDDTPTANTCLALLVLKRVNLLQDVAPNLPELNIIGGDTKKSAPK